MNVEKVASAVFMKFNEYEHRANVLMMLTTTLLLLAILTYFYATIHLVFNWWW